MGEVKRDRSEYRHAYYCTHRQTEKDRARKWVLDNPERYKEGKAKWNKKYALKMKNKGGEKEGTKVARCNRILKIIQYRVPEIQVSMMIDFLKACVWRRKEQNGFNYYNK